MSPAYSFRSTWEVPFDRERVHGLLVDLEGYPAWWPQVLAVAKVTDDDARVLCRSSLPYTLDLWLHAVSRERDLLETTVDGDLVGTVRWRLSEHGGGTRLDFEQDVRVAGRLLGLASYVARPVLAWNHHRMMAGCLAGLEVRLRSPADR